ncbi:hypothetical protein IFM89_015198 [Coptis chinensis]|uniref:PIPK domain-containing protein n=1 Tax=Coptis chinensis TaxID=261450 RepID=A0A835HHN3_9MAGN|nr:hypothetical protein IFM89_015198 [Coptis chinensis]
MCLYEKQFHDLRCPCELDYISSLSRCKNWDAKGGKSGSLFVKTLDDRFVIKQIQKKEYDSFVKFAHEYFKYTDQSLNSGSQTCLAKILGIYQVTIRQPKSGKDLKYELMVMENLLFGKNITHLYDLKGSEYARYTSNANGIGEVLLDGNFVEDMNVSPLYVSGKTKHALERALWNDTSFLTSINVMDYSLLVGVDMQQRELVCGIIDYLRQYTWEKQLETLAEASIVPRHATPTVVSPVDYKKRFRKFMSLHFISVPGHWCPETSAEPCKGRGIPSTFANVDEPKQGSNLNVSTTDGSTLQQLKRDSLFSELGPLKDNERKYLNCVVKEYMLLAGYRLTTMTVYEEVFSESSQPDLSNDTNDQIKTWHFEKETDLSEVHYPKAIADTNLLCITDQNLDLWQNTPACIPDTLHHYYYQYLSSTDEAAEEQNKNRNKKERMLQAATPTTIPMNSFKFDLAECFSGTMQLAWGA